MIRFLLIIGLFCSVLLASEQNNPPTIIKYCDSSFSEFVFEGNTILFLPVIINNEFSETPSFKKITKPINSRHKRLILKWYPTLLSTADMPTQIRIKRFEQGILANNDKETPKHLAVFEGLGIRYIQTLHISSFSSIKQNKYRIDKTVTVEAELWDTHLKRSVFCASATAQSNSQKTSDEEIVIQRIELLYGLLPKFYFNTSERNW